MRRTLAIVALAIALMALMVAPAAADPCDFGCAGGYSIGVDG